MTGTNHIRFTEAEISALPVTEKRTRWHDTQMPGLVLDVTAGKKAFRVYKKLAGRATPLSVTLGDFPALTVESARRLARKAMADMADGINPNDSKRQFRAASVKLSEVFQRFLEQRDLKDTTLRGYQQLMKCYLSDWQQKRMADISEDMVYKRHQKLSQSSRAQADYTMRTVRALFNFAKAEYKDSANRTLFPVNPVVVLSEKRAWNNVARRQTRLRPSQLAPFLQAINTLRDDAIAYRQDFTVAVSDYVEFTAYTGLRGTELLELLKEPAQRIVARINQYVGIDVSEPCDITNIRSMISGMSKEQKLKLLAELVV